MDKNLLLETANHLKQVSIETANEYQSKTNHLVELINSRMLSRDDIEELVGKKNIIMMKDNHANHARFMSSIFLNKNSEVLVETLLWVFRAYRSHGFTTNYWAAQLNTWIDILNQELSIGARNEIIPYYEWMQVNIPLFAIISDSSLDINNPMH